MNRIDLGVAISLTMRREGGHCVVSALLGSRVLFCTGGPLVGRRSLFKQSRCLEDEIRWRFSCSFDQGFPRDGGLAVTRYG